MLNNAWTLARKDLRLFFRDRTALALALALPILLATIFGSAMGAMTGGGGGGGLQKVDLQVEDLDDSQASRAFIERVQGVSGLRVTVAADARRAVAGGRMPAGLILPEGYGAALAKGQIPQVRLLRDPSRTIAQQVIAGNLMPVLLQSVIDEVGVGIMARVLDMVEFPAAGRAEAQAALDESWTAMDAVVARMEAEGRFADEPDADEPGDDEPGDDEPGDDEPGDGEENGDFNFLEDVPAMLGLVTEDVAGQSDDGMPRSAGASHAVAAMAVMMLMFSLVAAGGTLLEEQMEGTLLRLQLSPSGGPAILMGKLMSMGLMGLLQLTVLYVYGGIVFDVPVLEAPFLLALVSVGVVLAATGLGLLFATLCTSRKQLEGLSTLVILVMSAVGGAWFPREMTPEWFRFAGQFTITAYAMDAYHGLLWYGKGLWATSELDGIWREVAVLYGIGTGLTLLSFRLYRRRFVEGA